jgi:hypothetical protein
MEEATKLYEFRYQHIRMDPDQIRRLSIDSISIALVEAHENGYTEGLNERESLCSVLRATIIAKDNELERLRITRSIDIGYRSLVLRAFCLLLRGAAKSMLVSSIYFRNWRADAVSYLDEYGNQSDEAKELRREKLPE